MFFINNSNIKTSCLAKDKLHLDKSGNSILAKNILSVLKQLLHNTEHAVQVSGVHFIYSSSTSPDWVENINYKLKRLRHSHLNNIIFLYPIYQF